MKRLILAIFGGIVANFALATLTDVILHAAGVFPPYGQPFFDTGLVLTALSYRAIYQVFCSWLAARWARQKARTAVWTLGIIGTIFWLAGTLAMPGYGPLWYGIAGAVLAIPTSLLGGKIYELQTPLIVTQ